MQIYFDAITLADWKTRSVSEVFIQFVSKGCEGTKVRVYESHEYPEEALWAEVWMVEPLKVRGLSEEMGRFDGARLTQAKGKWIFTSAQVTGRCGCGSSFSFDKKVISKDKLALLKSRLAPAVTSSFESRIEEYSLKCEKPKESSSIGTS